MSEVVTLEERGRRLAHNEALFRDVNERLQELNETFSGLSGVMEIVCECGSLDCAELLSITPGEYQRIRSDSTWFAIVAGHEVDAVEIVVEHTATYDIVQKRPGAPAEQAIAEDERS